MKKLVYHQPVDMALFTNEKVLEQTLRDEDKLVAHWGKKLYDEYVKALKDAIACMKQDKSS